MLRRAVGPERAAAMVLFGEVLDGDAAARVGLVWTSVDDDRLLDTAVSLANKAAAAPRELAVRVKQTLGRMADVDTHDSAVDTELDAQVWSLQQPAFRERLAAMQQQISKRT
jgi:enoyl-CoA hydratase